MKHFLFRTINASIPNKIVIPKPICIFSLLLLSMHSYYIPERSNANTKKVVITKDRIIIIIGNSFLLSFNNDPKPNIYPITVTTIHKISAMYSGNLASAVLKNKTKQNICNNSTNNKYLLNFIYATAYVIFRIMLPCIKNISIFFC
ncbi:hypothetical protein CON56_21215 [Bacillus thuringiensis]|nr:hypothetical protein CON56_21215 [Bacillus thuringiensis]PFO91816.1 hypothetical protein COJ97_27305 [Bacillus cereus]